MVMASANYNCNKIAVFSDIHSNYLAFSACYEDAKTEGADCFMFLGDYVSGLSDSVGVLDLVYKISAQYPTVCVRGNRERYMIDYKKSESSRVPNLYNASYLYTYQQLREKDFLFFETLPFYTTVMINGRLFEVAHATRDSDRCLFQKGDKMISRVFEEMSTASFLTGHSHVPFFEKQKEKIIINPGSVGLPRGNNGLAQYALLDFENDTIHCEFRGVPYDYEKLIRTQYSSGMVNFAKFWAISDLHNAITGKPYTRLLLEKIYNYKIEDATIVDDQDEAIWRKFSLELGMHLTERELLLKIKTL